MVEDVAERVFHFLTMPPLLSRARRFEVDGLSACLFGAGGLQCLHDSVRDEAPLNQIEQVT